MTDISELWRFDLTVGHSADPRHGACVMDAVSWFEYQKLDDHPPCVCPVIASYARVMNDALPDAERQGLKPYIPRLAGTVEFDSEKARAKFLAWQAIKVFVPIGMRHGPMPHDSEWLANGILSFSGAARECVEVSGTAGYYRDHCFDGVAASKPRKNVKAWTDAVMTAHRKHAVWQAISVSAMAACNAAEARRPVKRAEWAAASAAKFVALQPGTLKNEIIAAMFAALDGVLAIGRQAPETDGPRMVQAVEAFGREREAAPA